MKPIEEFKDKEELMECVRWWQHRLFLDGWIITANLVEPQDFINEDVCGECSFDMTNHCAVIRILEKRYYGEDRIMKYCAERILVHELLHCKYNWLTNANSYEGKYVDATEHGLLEEMAKSFIMAKYGLTFDYFKNI